MRAGSLLEAMKKATGSVDMTLGRMGEILIVLTGELLQLCRIEATCQDPKDARGRQKAKSDAGKEAEAVR